MPDQLTDMVSNQSTLNTTPYASPWSALWWFTSTVSGINAESAGWHLAQGWKVTQVVYDNTTIPPTPYYAMTKESLNNMAVLQHLLNSFTIAQNNALQLNEVRYNEVIANWRELFKNTENYLDTQADEQTDHVTLFLANLDTYMNNIESLVADNSAAIDAAVVSVLPILGSTSDLMTAHRPEYEALVNSLLTDYEAYVTDFSAILDLVPADYDSYETDFSASLDLLPPDHTSYRADFKGVLNLLPPDYELHAPITIEYLTGLGATETARINEEFAARLATQLQELVDRGLYSSATATAIQERNARDRDEQIQALNDRLMREKLENQHKIYGQQQAMRDRILAGEDSLHGRQQSMRDRVLSGEDRLYERKTGMRDRVLSGTDRLHERKVEMRARTMEGKDRLHGLRQELLRYHIAQTLENAEAALRHKHLAIVELMNVSAARLAGLQNKHAENMELMKYMLNERNQSIIGVYGFVERREDVAPKWEALAEMVAGLGDAGGGWISP
jgi:hypothetical protein